MVDGLVNNLIKTRDDPGAPSARASGSSRWRPSCRPSPAPTSIPKTFYDLVKHPTDELLGDYPWLLDENVRPKGASLEGFLYPATYSIQVGDDNPTTAEDLVRQMLDAFHDRVGTPSDSTVPAKRGLSFYQVLTLASIVEREAAARRGAAADRRRLPEPARPEEVADGPAAGGPDDHLRHRHAPARRDVQFRAVAELLLLGQAQGAAAGPALPDGARRATTRTRSRACRPGPISTPTIASIDAALAPDTKGELPLLHRQARRQRRPRLREDARRARRERARSTARTERDRGPARSRRPARSRPTSPRRPMRPPIGAGPRRTPPIAPPASPRSARAWPTKASMPTSAPRASTCAGSPGSRSPRARTRSRGIPACSSSAARR